MLAELVSLTVPAAASAMLAYALSPFAARLAIRLGAIDHPGSRKVHTAPIPRLGGLAVITATALVVGGAVLAGHAAWLPPRDFAIGLGLGWLPILAVSVADDIRGVPARTKLTAHAAGAAIAVISGVSLGADVHLFGTPIHLGVLAAPLSILWIVGVTNAFNIIDGLDGLSAGLAFISAISLAAVFLLVGIHETATAALVLAGALLGFLPYNLHPARLFLGDTGATAIGFALAGLALRGGSTLSSGFAVLIPVLVMGLPVADTLVSIARRVVSRLERSGGSVFTADGRHIHHRLLALGLDHRAAVAVLYGAGVCLSAAAFLSLLMTTRETALLLFAIVVAGMVGLQRLGYDEFAIIRRGTVLRMYDAPVLRRSMFVVFVDIVLVVAGAYCAVGLKTDEWHAGLTRDAVLSVASVMAPLTVLVFWRAGLYRGSWKLASIDDYVRAGGATLGVVPVGLFLQAIRRDMELPVSLIGIYALVSVLLLVGTRASYRILLNSTRRANRGGIPVLIYGAGNRGAAVVRELFDNPGTGLRPMGFLDDDLAKKGRIVSGLPVLGPGRDLETIAGLTQARAVLVSSAAVPVPRVAETAAVCERLRMGLYRMQIQIEPLTSAAPAGISVAAATTSPGGDALAAPIR
jgi:UDP-GlcNAc:undecaprenyl-phosphate GlcNAc-1-phosphate transferase